MSNRVKKTKLKEFEVPLDVQGKEQPEVQKMVQAAIEHLLRLFDSWRYAKQTGTYKILTYSGPAFAQFHGDPHGTGRPLLMRVNVSLSILYEE